MRVDEMAAASSVTSAMPVTDEARRVADAPEDLQVSAALPPEHEVLPDVDLAHGEALHEKVPDEILRRREREVPRERHEDERVDPAGFDRLLALPEGLDHPGRALGVEDLERVRLERHDDGGRAELARAPRDVPEHDLVPEMHAVEVSDGHDAAAGKIDGTERILDDLQRREILSDDLPDEVVGVRLGDRHAHDLPDARHPALGHLVDEDAAVDLGGLRRQPPLQEEIRVGRGPFEEHVEGFAALRAVLRKGDLLLDFHQTVAARRFFFEWNRVPERLRAGARLRGVREDARVVEAHGLEELFHF